MSADKLASFRVDSQLWEQFQGHAKSQNSTATALLISYIKSVVNTSSEVNNPGLSTQDIDNRITESLADGKIGEAIASSYAGMMGQMNGLLDELQDLKSQLQELQSIPPAAAVPCSQLPIANEQLPITNEQIPDPNKNQIENIRTTLKRKSIQSASNDQIREAFKAAGWDGNNFNEIRKAIIDSLSAPK